MFRSLGKRSRNGARGVIAVLALVCASTGLVVVTDAAPSSAATSAASSPFSVTGRGASVPFAEQEAESAATNGVVIGPDRTYGSLASEASGRSAVTLNAVGQYVEFTLTQPANSIDVRYSIPDNAAGTGITAPISLLAGAVKLKDLSFTSKYGWYYGSYPFVNNPAAGSPHHFYDETRALLGSTYPAGTKIRLQVTSTAVASSFTIDLADFELVAAPLAKPTGAIDVVADYGADPTGLNDSTAKLQAAVTAGQAQHRVVWIPQGHFLITSHIIVDGVTLAGAGPWYSELAGSGVGIYGKYVPDGGPSRNVVLKDFAILGEVMERNDSAQVNAIGGAMSDSSVSDLWMQHTKVGAWMDGPMTNFTITNSRILDQTADGVNFHNGVSNSSVTNTFVRNTGDDGLAMWADTNPEVGNTFAHDTVVAPILANNIALYGGRDTSVTDNVVSDTVTNGGGIQVANRFPGVSSGQGTAIAGTLTLARNTLIRTGSRDYDRQFGMGGLLFDAANEPISGATINVTDTDLVSSSYEALQFVDGTTTGVHLARVNLLGAGTFAVQIQAAGSASFDTVNASGIGFSNPMYSCSGTTGFAISDATHDSGWQSATPYCGAWPNPVYGAVSSPVSTSPVPTTSAPSSAASTTAPAVNLAAGRPVTASSAISGYPATNTVDSNPATYWESAANAFPQTLTIDLATSNSISRAVVKLPPNTAWGSRSETIAVTGSTDGATYTAIKTAAAYTLDAATGNLATITFTATTTRYVRLTFTANTGWPAAQASEIELYKS